SPDGKFVIAADLQRKRSLYPAGGGEPRPIPGLADEDRIVRWSGDGRFLYVYGWRELPLKVYRLDLATGRKELCKGVMPSDAAGIRAFPQIFLTPDGKSYVYQLRRFLSDLYLVEGLM